MVMSLSHRQPRAMVYAQIGHSPAALPKATGILSQDIFPLLFRSWRVCPISYTLNCPAKASGCTQSTKEMPLVHLALVVKGVGVPELRGTTAIRKTVLNKKTSLEHSTDNRLKHTPIFLWKRPIYLYWMFSLKDRLQVSHTSMSYEGTFKECKQGDTILCSPQSHYSLRRFLRKELYNYPDCCNSCSEYTSRSFGMEVSRVYYCGPPRLYILHALKAAAWGSGFCFAWN